MKNKRPCLMDNIICVNRTQTFTLYGCADNMRNARVRMESIHFSIEFLLCRCTYKTNTNNTIHRVVVIFRTQGPCCMYARIVCACVFHFGFYVNCGSQPNFVKVERPLDRQNEQQKQQIHTSHTGLRNVQILSHYFSEFFSFLFISYVFLWFLLTLALNHRI